MGEKFYDEINILRKNELLSRSCLLLLLVSSQKALVALGT